MRRGRFEGWYFKQQCQGHTVAFIPARHRDAAGAEMASLQILLDENTWHIQLPAAEFSVKENPFTVRAGKCVFGLDGCQIDCDAQGASFHGALQYSQVVKPAGDIMGPFRFVPAMQCRHSLVSLSHRVDGTLRLNGTELAFPGGLGYIEGDRGRSFPRRYVWTQCGWEQGCVMLSVADIPLCGGGYTGCIASVYVGGTEYRLATYLGARPERVSAREVCLRQGPYRLCATLEEGSPLLLRAPRRGGMERRVRESLVCRVRYLLEKDGRVLLCRTDDRASFEAEWPQAGDGPEDGKPETARE